MLNPLLGHIIQGPGARVPVTGDSFVDGNDRPWWYYRITVAPGETEVFLNYAVLDTRQDFLVSEASQIAANPPLCDMTPEEVNDVMNFDLVGPVVTVPAPITVAATGPSGAVVKYDATATDAVDGTEAVSCAPPSGSTFPIGTTTVTCTSTDTSGNTTTRTFPITVTDAKAPVLFLPTPITVAATSPSGAAVSSTATAAEAVDGAVPVSCTPPAGSIFPVGVTTVTCTATDSAANTTTGTFVVTVTAPAPAPAPAPKPTPTPTPAPAPAPVPKLTPAPASSVKLAIPAQTLAAVVKAKHLTVRCTLAGAGTCAAKATITSKVATQLGLKVSKGSKSTTLSTATKQLKRKGTVTLTLKLSSGTVKALENAKSVKLTVTATSSAPKHSARTTTNTITLK